MFGIGWQELIIIAVVALIIVGPKKLPDLAKTLGKGIRDFKSAAEGVTDDLKDTLKEDEKPAEGNSLENTPLMKKVEDGETKNDTGTTQNPA
ncbi:MAG TPA: Sec-independent protein translocase protein TatB [Smithellaceae bacterium]|jgi:Tat protein translocase TatB subunit|nr:Sec-independent protein translocase protein TatB [Smithellaceae bacterium]HQF84877.1 Sec-independent protein translocase protein TatB [Smithellaceae bacterium]HQG81124.1 Sec-independent protein translocase protein TatB [Smithellaceae bacterium]